MLRAIGGAAVILAPRRLVGVLVKVAMRDVVMLTINGAAQAREVAFSLIGAGAIPAKRLRMVDPMRVVERLKVIPVRPLVGVNSVPNVTLIRTAQ